MGDNSKITTDLVADEHIQLDNNYRLDKHDRRYIDNQIIGVEQHLVDSLLSGFTATWGTLDGSSVPVNTGDVLCVKHTGVTKATTADLANAGTACGVVVIPTLPGSRVRFAIGGILPAKYSGLGAGLAQPVRVNTTTGTLERTVAYASSDYPFGVSDINGNVTLDIGAIPSSVATGGSVTWANDLAGSTNTSQVVVAASGASGKFVVRDGVSLVLGETDVAALITSGVGAPTLAAPDGSVYLRTDGGSAILTAYLRVSGAWVAVGAQPSGAPQVVYGAGAPTVVEPDGSLYMRTDGTDGSNGLYTRQGGVWYALGGSGGGGGAAPPAGYSAWWKASSLANGSVSSWSSTGTAAPTLSQATGGNQPTKSASPDVVSYNGTSNYLTNTTPNTFTAAFTVGVKFKLTTLPTSISDFQVLLELFSAAGGGDGMVLGFIPGATGYGPITVSGKAPNTGSVYASPTLDTTAAHRLVVTFNGSGANNAPASYQMFYDGVSQTMSAGSTLVLLNDNRVGAIFNGGSATNFFKGLHYDILVYPSVLSSTDITTLDTYLASL